jgi:hypothetical protein
MLTFGTTDPLGSVTVPTIVAVVWPHAAAQKANDTIRTEDTGPG